MINGTYHTKNAVVESICRTSKDYRFTDIGVYKIHSNVLMPEIPFEEARIDIESIDSSVFANDESTKPIVNRTIKEQNYLSTKYIGRAPLEFYQGNNKTKMGRQFILLCREGITDSDYRVFGTEAAIRGYNKNANENVYIDGGNEE